MSINPPDTNERALSKIKACLMAVLFPPKGAFILFTRRNVVSQLEKARSADNGPLEDAFVLAACSRLFPKWMKAAVGLLELYVRRRFLQK
jgi:hypothetical protein